jgi:hypothetical protein
MQTPKRRRCFVQRLVAVEQCICENTKRLELHSRYTGLSILCPQHSIQSVYDTVKHCIKRDEEARIA